MKIKCMLDIKKFNKKPMGYEIGAIQNRLANNLSKSQVEITVEELAEYLVDGCSFKPALLNGSQSIDWQSQSVFALDFDNDTTIQEELDRCNLLGIHPSFGYTSFSFTDIKHKFRLVFVTDEVITDMETRNKLQITLIKIFSKSDINTKDATRLFFGGKRLISTEYGNTINANEIIEKYYEEDKCKAEYVDTTAKEERGVQDRRNIYISYLSCTPLSSIPLISTHDDVSLSKIYGNHKTYVFETNAEFLNYITSEINLGEFLGIKQSNSFNCIFHNDSKPSASIFLNESDQYIYKCNSSSCNVSYNIVGTIERIGNFKSRPQTYKFIKKVFNLEVMETDWQKEQKEILFENLKALNNGEFEDICYQAGKNITGIKHYLERLHIIALDNIYNDKLSDDDGNVIFFASIEFICKQMNVSPNSMGKISQKLAVLSYHKVLNKLDDSQIPDTMFKKSKSVASNKKSNNHVNYFSIPSYTVNKFIEVEDRGIAWKKNGHTMKGMSREMIARGDGLETANELYPQYKKVKTEKVDKETGEIITEITDRTTTDISNKRVEVILKAIGELISSQGYCTEKQLIYILYKQYAYNTTETQLKRMRGQLSQFGLKRVKTTKELKIEYNIKGNGYPYIIINI